jgi:hypothetical protein
MLVRYGWTSSLPASAKKATFKPAPDEWSVNENLAHLIRVSGTQSFIADLISGQERYADDYGDNGTPMLKPRFHLPQPEGSTSRKTAKPKPSN